MASMVVTWCIMAILPSIHTIAAVMLVHVIHGVLKSLHVHLLTQLITYNAIAESDKFIK